MFYEDRPFVCVDCGKEEVWTAKQQQWWYEIAKGSIYSAAIRCRTCRKKSRAKGKDDSPTDHQPIRHVGTLMKLVRAEIEPAILAAGFVFEDRNKPRQPGERAWIDYNRNGSVLSIAFEREPRLVAELLDETAKCRTVAVTEFDAPRTRTDIMATTKAFASTVNEFMAKSGPSR